MCIIDRYAKRNKKKTKTKTKKNNYEFKPTKIF